MIRLADALEKCPPHPDAQEPARSFFRPNKRTKALATKPFSSLIRAAALSAFFTITAVWFAVPVEVA